MGSFAEVVLALFIPLAISLFYIMPPLRAAMVVALGAEMFLPGVPFFKLPLLPNLDKHLLPYVCILIGCLLRCRRRVTKPPKDRWFLLLSVLALVGGALTGLTNRDVIPCDSNPAAAAMAMTFKDGMAVGVTEFLSTCLTFYLGFALTREEADIERVLVALAKAGLIYCPLAILEMRLSPQLSGWVYGSQGGGGSWEQGIRWGGYRPTVFMPHGLALARFFIGTTLALFVLVPYRRRLFGIPVRLLAWFHAVVLVMCRSTGAIVLGAAGILVVVLTKPKRQLQVASILALSTVLYPLMRSSGIFPVGEMLGAAGSLNADRMQSLAFRFENEDLLLARARERLAFGWGTYGRNQMCDILTVPDGHWIIVLGVAGVAGFLVTFGVLAWPIILTRIRLRRDKNINRFRAISGLAMIIVLHTVDLIPNGLWGYYAFFLAGVLTQGMRLATAEQDRVDGRQAQIPQNQREAYP